MATSLIQSERIQPLNDRPVRSGDYVLYWMQQSQRAECNHALEYAIQQANELDSKLLVVFGLMDDYPEANVRHYRFLLEGLRETREALERRGILLVVDHGPPDEVALRRSKSASLVVCDCGYLRHQRAWRRKVAREARCRVVQVESDAIVPVETLSDKAEYAARTIRPKFHKQVDRFLVELTTTALEHDSLDVRSGGMEIGDVDGALAALKLDRGVPPVERFFRGGTREAKRHLRRFLSKRLSRYQENRNRPETDDVSYMGMYLHFGQISPVAVALEVRQARGGSREDRESYLEELGVRRSLAQNFVHYTRDYDRFRCLPDWAQRTLRKHGKDRREQRYTLRELDAAQTHDPYWNAAMQEMKHTGYMHNYMRMYWGKKILEWSATPQRAFKAALSLNNKYFLDGRDPNSYANVAWVFGLHDRPWQERKIFGTVRYMSASGLERKCDIEAYVRKVDRLTRKASAQT